jgi:hypothetical protein
MLPRYLLAGAAATLLIPAAANASTVTREGDTLVVRGAPGELNYVSVGPSDAPSLPLRIGDSASLTSDVCTSPFYGFVDCDMPSGGVRVEAGDNNDVLNISDKLPSWLVVSLDGGPGDDVLRGAPFTATTASLIGGPGNDKVFGGVGGETLDGGAGDDELEGRGGPDTVRGGEGNDTLQADYFEEQSTDVIDGGPGIDQMSNNWVVSYGKVQPPITASIDGVANDGRPGENDNLTGVEKLYFNAEVNITGSDGPDELTVFNNDGPSTLVGRGGDDRISGFDLDDTIDGGAGDDTIEGGYGHDTIVGGPGRDTINGDITGTGCHWIQCRSMYGNDHIDARDGEIDTVTCGIGDDVVEADANDNISPDCETVNRGTAPAPVPDEGKPGTAQRTAALTGVRVHRKGARVTVTGRAVGATKVTAKATRRGRTVARASASVRRERFTVKLRAPRHSRVVLSAGGATKRLSV